MPVFQTSDEALSERGGLRVDGLRKVTVHADEVAFKPSNIVQMHVLRDDLIHMLRQLDPALHPGAHPPAWPHGIS